jgi:hypothetical protein
MLEIQGALRIATIRSFRFQSTKKQIDLTKPNESENPAVCNCIQDTNKSHYCSFTLSVFWQVL